MISAPSFTSPLLYLSNSSLNSSTSQCTHMSRPLPRKEDSGDAAQTVKSAGRETRVK